MLQLIAPSVARQTILQNTTPLETQTIAHAVALGRVLASDVFSTFALPPFANSAMDGYAVVAQDTHGATSENPSTLRLLETVAAGEVGSQAVVRGSCIKIMTGGKIPAGADAVVMREETREENAEVHFFAEAQPLQNIRPTGDDVNLGERVLERGSLIRPAEWAMLASLGCAQVEVFRQPRVAIIATGKELVDVNAALHDGQIYDSNSFALAGLCQQVGAVTVRTRVGDDPEELRAALREYSAHCDCIITSGGVSVGDFDPVRDVLLTAQTEGEANIHFWKIAMKPGKPVMFATLNGKSVFGLPGNPVSVMVAWEQYVRPALLKMQGRHRTQRLAVDAEVHASFKSPRGKVEFVRAHVTHEAGVWQARLTGDQGSGRLSSMTRANALLIVPAETTRVESGDRLRAELLDCGEW
jgi:molybdopterin molybdotransferase